MSDWKRSISVVVPCLALACLPGVAVAVDCSLDAIVPEDQIGVAGVNCDANGVRDECEISGGAALDCNANDVLDVCEIGPTLNFERSLLPVHLDPSFAVATGDVDGDGNVDAVTVGAGSSKLHRIPWKRNPESSTR